MIKVRTLLGEIMEETSDPGLKVTPLVVISEGCADTENILSDRGVRIIPRLVLRLPVGRPIRIAQMFLQVPPHRFPTLLDLHIVVFSDDFAFHDKACARSLNEINAAIFSAAWEAMQLRTFWQEQLMDESLKRIANICAGESRIYVSLFKSWDVHVLRQLGTSASSSCQVAPGSR